MSATPLEDSDHHQTDTAHGLTDVSSFSLSGLKVAEPFWRMEFIGDVGLVSCCPFGAGHVGRSMYWHAECFMRVMFRSRILAIQFLVKKADREMMRHLRLALPGLRQETEEPEPKRKKLALKRDVPIGQHRNQIGTEQSEFQETRVACDKRGHLHDSDGQRR